MSADLEERFIDSFRLAARQAGAVALRLQGKVCAQTKPGSSPEAEALTAVDLATQDVILHLLHRDLPEVAMDAEEQTETVALFASPTADGDRRRPVVVVDPVDGTLNYIRGSADFGVMGALLRDGRFQAGLVHLPVSGTTCWAVRGGGCFVDGPEGPRRVHTGGAEPTIFYDPRTPAAWRDALSRRFGHIELSRCSAVDAPAPATGRARGGISAGHADRRQAIGLFLTLEAGGAVRIGGQRWQGEDPELAVGDGPSIVAEDDALADAILAAVASAGGGVGQSIP